MRDGLASFKPNGKTTADALAVETIVVVSMTFCADAI
jgi:hypothetical protein